MLDPGYTSYQDPRLQPIERDYDTCESCRFYRELDGAHTAAVGLCVFDIYNAGDYDELSRAYLARVDFDDDACDDYVRE